MLDLRNRMSIYQPDQPGLKFPEEPRLNSDEELRLYRKKRLVAAKIGRNKEFDQKNGGVEIKLLKKVQKYSEKDDLEGHNRIVRILDDLKFR